MKKNNRILIFGKGFVGARLKEALGCSLTDRRIVSFKDAREEVDKFKPAIIINAIGHTGGKNVDGCEEDPDKTLSANTFVPLILAEVALRRKIKFVHISSGCIYQYDYNRAKPLTEADVPDFFDLFYSRTKIYTERALEVLSDRYDILIVRIRIPLDERPHPRNILTKLLSFPKVIDAPNSITYIPDFIKALQYLMKVNARGIYNVVNSGGLQYPALLKCYQRYRPDHRYEVINYKKLKLVRTNLILSTRKLEKTGFKVRPINGVLDECVKNYLKY